MEEIAKNLQNLSQQVEELVKLQNDAYSKLQPEVYEKVKQHHACYAYYSETLRLLQEQML